MLDLTGTPDRDSRNYSNKKEGIKFNALGSDDTITGSNWNDTFWGGDGNDYINGKYGRDELYGDEGNDTILGSNQNDTIWGGDGDDKIDGGAHDDSIYGDDTVGGNDTLVGGYGNDTLFGGAGNDELAGDGNDDLMDGGAGNDFLRGGFGNDTLLGGDGSDTLKGYGGLDTFGYTAATEGGGTFDASNNANIQTAIGAGGYDVITDFAGLGVAGGDTIQLGFGGDILPTVQTSVGGNILAGGYNVFAYEFSGSTYIIYDANGNNTSGSDSYILAQLQGISGVGALDGSDFG